MARVGVGDLYHLALNGLGYMLTGNGYTKRDANDFVSRFSTGGETLDDLNLYKNLQQTDFSGGQFQKQISKNVGDPTKLLQMSQLEWSVLDSVLYLTPNRTLMAGGGFGAPPTAFDNTKPIYMAMYHGELYVANARRIDKWNPNTVTWTNMTTTLPGDASGVAVVADAIWWPTSGNAFYQYAPGSGLISDAAYGWNKIVSYENNLIATGNPSSLGGAGKIWKKNPYVGGAPGATAIGDVGDINLAISTMKVFNHRLYIGKPDGLFAYDNATISQILDYTNYIDLTNFKAMEIYGGYLWFSIRSDLYRYNGAAVEKVQRFPANITVLQVAVGQLYIGLEATGNGADVYRFDLDTGFELNQSYSDLGVSGIAYVGATSAAGSTIDYLVIVTPKTAAAYFNFNIMSPFTGTAAAKNLTGFLETSEYDCDLPRVDKYLRSVMIDTAGIETGDSILVEYKVHDGQNWGSYQTLGTITPTSGNRLSVYDTSTLTTTFRKIQLKFSLTKGASNTKLAIRNWSAEYYLAPPLRWEWQITVRATGQSERALERVDGSPEPNTPRKLRDNIRTARNAVPPVGFQDIDYCAIQGATLSAGNTTVTVDNTDAFNSSGFITVEDEIIKYTGKTATTFTGCTRGALGTTAATHTAGQIVNSYYLVVVSKILRIDVQNPSQDAYGSEALVTLVLEQA